MMKNFKEIVYILIFLVSTGSSFSYINGCLALFGSTYSLLLIDNSERARKLKSYLKKTVLFLVICSIVSKIIILAIFLSWKGFEYAKELLIGFGFTFLKEINWITIFETFFCEGVIVFFTIIFDRLLPGEIDKNYHIRLHTFYCIISQLLLMILSILALNIINLIFSSIRN